MLGIFTVLLFVGAVPCQARRKDNDERSLNFLLLLAKQPHLLVYQYLVAALGAPTRVSVLPGGLARQAEWFDYGSNHLRYRYQQEFGALVLNAEVRNHFELILPEGTKIDLADLAKRIDSNCQTHFDERGFSCGQFRVSPNVILQVYQPDNYRALSEIDVSYVGNNLPQPQLPEILKAAETRRREAFEQQSQGSHAKAAPLLCSYLHDFPNDAEAHLRLGDSYKACGLLNEAINQYRLTYVLAQSDLTVRDSAFKALAQLNVALSAPNKRQNSVAAKLESLDGKMPAATPAPAKSVASSAKNIEVGF